MIMLLSLLVLPAHAQDDDDWFDDEEVEEDEAERIDADDEIDAEEDPEDDEWTFDEEEAFDDGDGDFFRDDEEDDDITQELGQPGQDSAAIYREARARNMKLGSEDELVAWENYLEEYPNSLFMSQIEARIDELGDEVYSQRIGEGFGPAEDAMRQEINFAQPLLLESIDPRTKVRLGFELGLPNYLAGHADLEWQILREFSVHGGYHKRYSGGNLEAGAKYALVKSKRTNTLVTGMLDFHYNVNPGFPALRPQVGVGKRFDVVQGLDVQLIGGGDFEFRSSDGVQIRTIGGANATLIAADNVAVFFETSTNLKHILWEEGTFAFNVLTFGFRFMPGEQLDLPMQAALAADVPYSTQYWGYHYGAVQGDFQYFPLD